MGQLCMLANIRKPTFLCKRLTNQQAVIRREVGGGGVELSSLGEFFSPTHHGKCQIVKKTIRGEKTLLSF